MFMVVNNWATMFIRYRRQHHKLKVYLVENERVDGKVSQRIVAYLGSMEIGLLPENEPGGDSEKWERLSIQSRKAFWDKAGPKLKRLGNRLGEQARSLRMKIHSRIPFPLETERKWFAYLDAKDTADLWNKAYRNTRSSIEAHEKMAEGIKERLAALREDGLREINHANSASKKAYALKDLN